MKIKSTHFLYIINVLIAILVLVIYLLPDNVIRIILGLPFVLFAPGYTLIAALFPRQSSLDRIQRLALSLGLSIAVVPIIGLILNYTWGITLNSIVISLTAFVFIMSAIARFKLRGLPDEEQVFITIPRLYWQGRTRADKILSIILVVAIVGALGMAIYAIATPKTGQRFTEFYILDIEGNATEYPTELQAGDSGTVLMGIINHEYEEVSYRVEVLVDGELDNTIGPVVLNNEEKSEQVITFTTHEEPDRQKVDFLLYRDGQEDVYRELRLWVNVASP